MKRLSEELKTVSVQLMPRVVMTVERAEGVENGAYNSIHSDVSRFLDTVRRNEGLTTIISRVDEADRMRLEVGFTDHDAAKAIESELVKKTSRACAKHGIEAVRVGFSGAGKSASENNRTILFMDGTSNKIWSALREIGISPDGRVAGNIRWQAVFFIGPAGSGKTFIRNLKYVRHLDFKVVDPDEIKKTHPEYDPEQPQKIHDWSQKASTAQFTKTVNDGTGTPIIIDGTGRNIENRILPKMKEAEDNGYRTYIVYVYVPLQVSIFRNRNRKRFVPEEIIVEQADKIYRNFTMLKSRADKSKVIHNFERPELAKAKEDIEVYPVPQKRRPPRPGDPMYGVDSIAASIVGVAERLVG